MRPYLRWLLRSRLPRLAFLTALGPGLISGFADNDAGGITTYSVVGAQFGYDLMWVVLASMLALAVTQEIGARLGLATGQGFGGLIRQQYGVPRAAFAIGVMLLANLGDTVAEFAGIGAALAIFGVPIWLSSALAALAILFLLSRANFRRIQFVFLAVGIGTSLAYAISAILAHPDWGSALSHTVVPHGSVTTLYLLAVMGTVGTTITPWGQAFIQSYAADKHLGPKDLPASRIDVAAGAFLTNLVAGFIVVACAATLWSHGQTAITTAADAARALGPLAGRFAELLFALGLLTASLLGLGTVPLTSAYAVTEAFGWEKGLDRLIRLAGVLHRILRALRPDPGPAADRRHVPEPGVRRLALALHPGLRHGDEPGSPAAGAPAQQSPALRRRLGRDRLDRLPIDCAGDQPDRRRALTISENPAFGEARWRPRPRRPRPGPW